MQIDIVTREELDADLGNVNSRLDAITSRLDAMQPDQPAEPVPPPSNGEIVLNQDHDLQAAIYEARGAWITLEDGTYPPIKVVTGTKIRARNAGKAVISGLVNWSDGWSTVPDDNGTLYYKPFKTPLHQHPARQVHGGATPSPRGIAHRKAMIPHLLVFNGDYMLPVHSESELLEGCFMLDGTADAPRGLWARFPFNPTTSSVHTSFAQRLVSGDSADTDDVELHGLTFMGCANTKTIGAIDFPAESNNWHLVNCAVDLGSGEGVFLRGKDHVLENVFVSRFGITCFTSSGAVNCRLIGCEGSYGAWKPGLDVLWHSGNKFTNSSGLYLKDFVSRDMDGAGLWMDIWNIDCVVDGFLIDGSLGFGVHIEHHTKGSVKHGGMLMNGLIKGVRKWNGIGSGLQIQSNVVNYLFQNIEITECEDGAVYYKKREDRGPSGLNTFDTINHHDNGNGNRWRIQGDVNAMKDEYINVTADFNVIP